MADKIWFGFTTGSEKDYGVADNWSPSGVPVSGDTVTIPSASNDITASLSQSAVLLTSFRIEAGYSGTIGVTAGNTSAAPSYLSIDTDACVINGEGTYYLAFDHASGTPDVEVISTGQANEGGAGCYLKGTGSIDELSILAGYVSIGVRPDESLGFNDGPITVLGGSLTIGAACNLSARTVHVHSGEVFLEDVNSLDAINVNGGECTLDGSGTCTTVAVRGTARFVHNTTGTVTTLTIDDGGTVDAMQTGLARTVTNLDLSNGEILYDSNSYTVTNLTAQGKPISLTATQAL